MKHKNGAKDYVLNCSSEKRGFTVLWLKWAFWRSQRLGILNFSLKNQYLLDLDDWDINVAIQEENNEPQNFGPPPRKLR